MSAAAEQVATRILRIAYSRNTRPRKCPVKLPPMLQSDALQDQAVRREQFGRVVGLTIETSHKIRQKSQSSSSVTTALPITYELPDPEKKSWFSSAFGERAERIAGFTSVTEEGNMGS